MKYLEIFLEASLKFLSMMFLVLLPIRPLMIAVSVLVLADLITGIWASKKEGKKITSSGIKKTVAKTLAYQSCIVIAFVIETWLISDMPIVKVVGGLIALTEGKSFFENINRITGVDFWSEILKRAGGELKSQMEDQDKK